MKIRTAWKIVRKGQRRFNDYYNGEDFDMEVKLPEKYSKAYRTIETRTRRHYLALARYHGYRSMMGKYYTHTAWNPYLMEDMLYPGESEKMAGKSFHIFHRVKRQRKA